MSDAGPRSSQFIYAFQLEDGDRTAFAIGSWLVAGDGGDCYAGRWRTTPAAVLAALGDAGGRAREVRVEVRGGGVWIAGRRLNASLVRSSRPFDWAWDACVADILHAIGSAGGASADVQVR